jgi:hypothetical protein
VVALRPYLQVSIPYFDLNSFMTPHKQFWCAPHTGYRAPAVKLSMKLYFRSLKPESILRIKKAPLADAMEDYSLLCCPELDDWSLNGARLKCADCTYILKAATCRTYGWRMALWPELTPLPAGMVLAQAAAHAAAHQVSTGQRRYERTRRAVAASTTSGTWTSGLLWRRRRS